MRVREVSPEYTAVVKQLKKHVSDLMIIIKRAAHFLKPIKVYAHHNQVNSEIKNLLHNISDREKDFYIQKNSILFR